MFRFVIQIASVVPQDGDVATAEHGVNARHAAFIVWLFLTQLSCALSHRPAARRLQNMGWTPDGQLWVTTRGGDVLISPESGVSDKFEDKKIGSRGFGILDVG